MTDDTVPEEEEEGNLIVDEESEIAQEDIEGDIGEDDNEKVNATPETLGIDDPG